MLVVHQDQLYPIEMNQHLCKPKLRFLSDPILVETQNTTSLSEFESCYVIVAKTCVEPVYGPTCRLSDGEIATSSQLTRNILQYTSDQESLHAISKHVENIVTSDQESLQDFQ